MALSFLYFMSALVPIFVSDDSFFDYFLRQPDFRHWVELGWGFKK